jgi:hypothetical protein
MQINCWITMSGGDEPLTGTLDELATNVLTALGGDAAGGDVCYVQIQSAQGQAGEPPPPEPAP